ncbi:hypothetical protein DDV96_00005 [Marixanthomonas spongiae]|uniref:Uncharacterized protein n=1 Tax=Marixanthomonas spongiae TaxID=2174845 RepID=A0A2U0I770_9FLAO|nr:hypothetical protein DDV96_00005 [Marixanthomonas spongiae]
MFRKSKINFSIKIKQINYLAVQVKKTLKKGCVLFAEVEKQCIFAPAYKNNVRGFYKQTTIFKIIENNF